MPAWRELAAVALVTAAAAVELPTNGWNATAHYALVESLADGTPVIDGNLNQSGDIAWIDDHFYAAKSPGLAFLSLPVYLLFSHASALPEKAVAEAGPPGARFVERRALWQVNLVVLGALLALMLLVRLAVEHVVPGFGTLTAVVLVVSTMLLPFATSYFSHVVSTMLGFAAFVTLLHARGRPSWLFPAAAGVLAGLAVFTEAPLAIVAVILGLYAAVDRPRLARALSYGAGLLVGLLPLGVYNWWSVETPFSTVYSSAVERLGVSGHDVIGANDDGFFGLTAPDPLVVPRLLFSERGLITLTPVARRRDSHAPGSCASRSSPRGIPRRRNRHRLPGLQRRVLPPVRGIDPRSSLPDSGPPVPGAAAGPSPAGATEVDTGPGRILGLLDGARDVDETSPAGGRDAAALAGHPPEQAASFVDLRR